MISVCTTSKDALLWVKIID